MNIPIYRARKIDSDEYVIGMLTKRVFTSYLLIRDNITTELSKIDATTLSISFPDMLDSEGDRIFASLSEDGKGGDIIEYNGKKEIIKYSNGTIQSYMFRFEDLIDLNIEVIGILE